jgi:peptidoglycan/LPS O-acetylase OafA/YrhL
MLLSHSRFLEKFRRITSAGNYIPEIDGLRFVAIFWVVVWMHLPGIINTHLFNGKLINDPYISAVILEGGQGVSFFFMISGFILALPFIKEKVSAGPKVSLKKYYLRRLTRLEPPYLAALLILIHFIGTC